MKESESLSRSSLPPGRSGVPIRVGINGLDVNPSFVGGVTTYALGLLEGFAAAGDDCRFRVFVTPKNEYLFARFREHNAFEILVVDDGLFSLRTAICRTTSLSSSGALHKVVSNLVFRKTSEAMDEASDVLYTPTPVFKWFNSRKPTVLSMHDIQHVHHPEFFSMPRRISRRVAYGLSSRHAAYFQASSNYIKSDLLNHFPWLSPDQVAVIPSGVLVEKFAAPANDSLLARHQLPERFLLFPAQLWPHKNHLTVLKALKQIETKHGARIPLVLTGEKFSAASDIFKFVREQSMDYVYYLGKVSFPEIVALYQKATFMITATLHESSSLPILEAAAAGNPIIASRIPPIEELGQVLQLNLFNPLDVEGLARLTISLWEDERTPASQAAHNRERIGCYSWENTARRYVELFKRVVTA